MAINFRIRDFCHPILIGRLWREFERNQWLPPDELRRLQEARLQRIITRAYAAVPYYRRLFDAGSLKPADIRTLDDLPKLPLLGKADAQAAGEDLRAADSARFHPVESRTSGTSGTPFALIHCKYANALEFVYYWRHWSWAGYRLGDPIADLGSYYFLKARTGHDRTHAYQPHLRRLMLNSALISIATARTMAEAIEHHGSRFMKGVASSLYYLALSLQESGRGPLPLRAVISTGEILPPYRRALIEKVFCCRVFDSYGHMERTVAVSQCEKGGRHVNSDYGILEFIHSHRSEDGGGRLAQGVGTGLHSLVMPFIRYETGDEFELYDEPRQCPCGRTFPLVKAIHGRMEETIMTPDGRFLTSLFILPELVSGIRETQFVQEAADRLLVRVVPADHFDTNEEDALKAATQKILGASMSVRIVRSSPADLIRGQSGKLRTIISLTPEPRLRATAG